MSGDEKKPREHIKHGTEWGERAKFETKRERAEAGDSLWPVLVLLVSEWFNGFHKTHTHRLTLRMTRLTDHASNAAFRCCREKLL